MAKVTDIREVSNKVTIVLGGKERELRFDMNAFAELEIRFGSIEKAMEQLASGQMRNIRMVLWVALIHAEVKGFDEDTGEPTGYNITPYEVGSWITNMSMLGEISELLGQAMQMGMPDIASLDEEAIKELEAKGVDVSQLKTVEDEESKND